MDNNLRFPRFEFNSFFIFAPNTQIPYCILDLVFFLDPAFSNWELLLVCVRTRVMIPLCALASASLILTSPYANV